MPEQDALLLYFAEDRGSDGLFVQVERADLPFSMDPSNYRTEVAYQTRFCTDEGNVVAAGDYMIDEIEKFYGQQKAKAA